MIVTRRRRDSLLMPLAFLGVALYFAMWPLIWLAGLPNDFRYERLHARAIKNVDIDLDDVVAVRWYMRQISTMASGVEDDHYFVLTRANGSTVIIYDSYDAQLQKRLELRGLLPAQTYPRSASSGCSG
jgi:hypothetical protein